MVPIELAFGLFALKRAALVEGFIEFRIETAL